MRAHNIGVRCLAVSVFLALSVCLSAEEIRPLLVIGYEGQTRIVRGDGSAFAPLPSAPALTKGRSRDSVVSVFLEENDAGALQVYCRTRTARMPFTLDVFAEDSSYELGLNGQMVEEVSDICFDRQAGAPVYTEIQWYGEPPGSAFRAESAGLVGPLDSMRDWDFVGSLAGVGGFQEHSLSKAEMQERFPSESKELGALLDQEWLLIGQSPNVTLYLQRSPWEGSRGKEYHNNFLVHSETYGLTQVVPLGFLSDGYAFDDVCVIRETLHPHGSSGLYRGIITLYCASSGTRIPIPVAPAPYHIMHADEEEVVISLEKHTVFRLENFSPEPSGFESSIWRIPISQEGPGEPEYVCTLPFEPIRLFLIPEKFRDQAEALLEAKGEPMAPARFPTALAVQAAAEGTPHWYAAALEAEAAFSRHVMRDAYPEPKVQFAAPADRLAALDAYREASPFSDPEARFVDLPAAIRVPLGDGTYKVFTQKGDKTGRFTYQDLDVMVRSRNAEIFTSSDELFVYSEEKGAWEARSNFVGKTRVVQHVPDEEGVLTLDLDDAPTRVMRHWRLLQKKDAPDAP